MADDQFPRKTKKVRVSLSIDSKLVEEAKSYDFNISKTAEDALLDKVKRERGKRWAAENHQAIESTREFIEKFGTPAEILGLI